MDLEPKIESRGCAGAKISRGLLFLRRVLFPSENVNRGKQMVIYIDRSFCFRLPRQMGIFQIRFRQLIKQWR